MEGNKKNEDKGSAIKVPLIALIKKNRKIFFDSSALNSEAFCKFIDKNKKLVRNSRETLYIPKFEFDILNNSAKDIIREYIGLGAFLVLDTPNSNDFTHFASIVKDMSKEKGQLCFVSNSMKATRVILSSFKKESIYIQLFHIDESGDLISGMPKENGNFQFRTNPKQDDKAVNKPALDKFTITGIPERINVRPINVNIIPSRGSVVYNSKQEPITLLDAMIYHHNAITFSTNIPNVWAKIYKASALNTFVEAKVKKMLSRNIQFKGLCWPIDIIRDAHGQFLGFVLPPAYGEPLQLSVFKQTKLQKLFPYWNKKDLCDLTITILQIIQYLHSKNILLGCINPAAIRIKSKNEVYFIETDNYQIEGFPSLIYNTTFTPPEYLGRKIYLCKKENENYAVAVLVFMLMMPGKLPYTKSPNMTIDDAIQERKFPFPCGNVHGSHAMPSVWRFMWSHLTPFKDVFYNTFQKGGKLENPVDRKTVGSWIGTVKYFREELENPTDTESLKLYPQTFKKSKNEVFYTCRYCGVSHPKFYFDNRYFDSYRICNSCIDKRSNVSFICKACGKTYYYTNKTDLFHRTMKSIDTEWKDQKYCRDCKNKTIPCCDCGEEKPYYSLKEGRCHTCNDKHRNAIWGNYTCKDCGSVFSVTVGEREFALKNNHTFPPVRCKSCREKRKNNKW